jgi:hypothetical protein
MQWNSLGRLRHRAKRLRRLAALAFGIGIAASCQRGTSTSNTTRQQDNPAPSVVAGESSARIPPLPLAIAGQANGPAATTPTANGPTTHDDLVVDSPPWPEGMKSIRLAWVIYPDMMRKERGVEFPARRIELVLRSGKIARRFTTEQRYSITYATSMQRRCQGPAFSQGRVAELFMNGGGNTVLAVDRKGSELLLTEEHSSDGRCEPAPCPTDRKLLARFPVPKEVQVTEHFHIVEGKGKEHDETCEPAPASE